MPSQRTAPVFDGVAIALAACALYLALGQSSLYYTDGHFLLESLRDGAMASSRHSLARPIFSAWRTLTGLPAHVAITSACAISSAVGVGMTHAIARTLGFARGPAALATLLFATIDPVVFFASLVEYHGLFLGFATVPFWIGARWSRCHRRLLAIPLGAAAAVAAHVHLSGIALGFGAALWAGSVASHPSIKRTVGFAGLALAVQLGCFVLLAATLRALDWLQPAAWQLPPSDVLVDFVVTQLLAIPFQGWKEWLVPFVPLSLVPLAALCMRSLRIEALSIVALVLIWSTLCALNILIAPEYGAYLTPLAVPAAILAARAVPSGWSIAMIAIGLSLSLLHVLRHDVRSEAYGEWTRAARAATAPAIPAAIVIRGRGPHALEELPDGAIDEIAACLVGDPAIRYVDLGEVVRSDPAYLQDALGLLGALVRSRAGDSPILISRATVDQLAEVGRFASGPDVLAALREAFEFAPAGAFDGFVLEAKR